jgi:acetoin utilization deacetylase AcuC-like enzyme
MSSLAFSYHADYLLHDTGPGHPERPDRLRTLVQHLLGTPVWRIMDHLQPAPAAAEVVQLVHPQSYVETIERRCRAGERVLDEGDTHACQDSYRVALLAAGGVVQAVETVLSGVSGRAFCAVRPPGHHAETSRVMGFCLFNNVAIAARYAQRKHGVERVAIVDWDVHHGNGTQEIFYADDTVLYCSLHQYPFYPGTGARGETGTGKGAGYTVNCPLPAGCGEEEYTEAFQESIVPALDRFQPQLLLISAGFDAHRDDPLANMMLSDESFGVFTSMMMDVASRHSAGRIVSVLEGGYNLEALARSVEKHLQVMAE